MSAPLPPLASQCDNSDKPVQHVQPRVAVVGAGVIGLLVALHIKQTLNDVQVVVIADKFFQETTSYVAGGLWEPHLLSNTPPLDINRWSSYAYNYYKNLFVSDQAGRAGVARLFVQNIFTKEEPRPTWADIPHSFVNLDKCQLKQLGLPSKYTHGFQFISYVAEPR